MCHTRGTSTATLAEIFTALQRRRTAPSYSTAYHHNERALTLARSFLISQAPLAFLTQNPSVPRPPLGLSSAISNPNALLYRIVANTASFSAHYRAQLAALQTRQVHGDSVSRRRAMAVRFESGHGSGEGRDVDVGMSLAASVVERRGCELEDELRRFVNISGPLGSHPVSSNDADVTELAGEFKFVVEMEVQELVEEPKKSEKREEAIDGVDGDMILAFWGQYLD